MQRKINEKLKSKIKNYDEKQNVISSKSNYIFRTGFIDYEFVLTKLEHSKWSSVDQNQLKISLTIANQKLIACDISSIHWCPKSNAQQNGMFPKIFYCNVCVDEISYYYIFDGGRMKSNVGFVIHLLIGHWLSV